MKVIDDHAMMIKPNGGEKLIPFDQINFWIDNGIFEKVGYTFKDPEQGQAGLKRWNALKAQRAARAKLAKGTILRDEGPAGAHLGVVSDPSEVEPIGDEPDGTVAYAPEPTPPPPPAATPPTPAAPAGEGIPGVEVVDALEEPEV